MFLAPAFLLGLLAIGVPLWLHRVARANPTQHRFASLMLLEASETQRTAKRTLRYWLLLATRILLLIALVLAFAGPLLTSRIVLQTNANARLHAILIDASMSMKQGDRWTRALEQTEQILSDVPSSDRVVVLTGAGRRITPISDSVPANNLGTIRAALRTLTPGIERLDYGFAMSTANGWLGSPRPPVVLHLISDMQRSAAPLRFADLQLPPQTEFVTHDVSFGVGGNAFIADAALQTLDTHSLQVSVGNTANQTRKLDVILRVDDKETSRKNVTLSAAASAPAPVAGEGGVTTGNHTLQSDEARSNQTEISFTKVTFSDVSLSAGAHRIQVSLEPNDELSQDDQYYGVLEQSDPTALLITRDQNEDDAAYFAAAIGSLSSPRMKVEQRVANGMEGGAGLNKYSLIVIADPDALSGAAARRIHSYVAGGGAVLATLGETASSDNPLIGDLNVGETRNRSGRVGEIATTHPILRDAGDWNRVRFFRQRSVEPKSDDNVLIKLNEGAPLLIERNVGAGHMLILTAPVDRRWNDLAIHPLFVQFIGSAASYLTKSDAATSNAVVGVAIPTGLTASDGGQIFDPQGRRVLGLAQTTADHLVPDQAGFYEIRGSEGARWLAVNVDTRESDLAPLSPDFIARWRALPNDDRRGVQSAPNVPAVETPPKSLGPWLLWLAAILLGAELLLANHHLAIRREVPK